MADVKEKTTEKTTEKDTTEAETKGEVADKSPAEPKAADTKEADPKDDEAKEGAFGDVGDPSGADGSTDSNTDPNSNYNDDYSYDTDPNVEVEVDDADVVTEAPGDNAIDLESDAHNIDGDDFGSDVGDGTETYDFGSVVIGLPSDQFGETVEPVGPGVSPIEADEIDPATFEQGAEKENYAESPELSLEHEDAAEATQDLVDDFFQPEAEPELAVDDFDFLDDAPVG